MVACRLVSSTGAEAQPGIASFANENSNNDTDADGEADLDLETADQQSPHGQGTLRTPTQGLSLPRAGSVMKSEKNDKENGDYCISSIITLLCATTDHCFF